MFETELSIFYFFNHTIASPFMDSFMDLMTNVHYWYGLYIFGGIFLIWKYKWHGFRMVLGAVVLVAFTDSLDHYILKPWIGRLRPCALLANGQHVISWVRLPIGMKWDPSFPSAHALNNFAIATFFSTIFQHKRPVRFLFLVAFIISIGRIYEGVHYPSDIVGGALIGMLIGLGFAGLSEYLEERLKLKYAHLPAVHILEEGPEVTSSTPKQKVWLGD